MVILDTSIVIDHVRQTEAKETLLMRLAQNYSKDSLAISVISIQELYEGQSTLSSRKEELLLATIAPLKILAYTYEVAQLAGQIARDSKSSIDLADAAIAATTILNHAKLCTLNIRDFKGIKKLELLSN